MLCTAFRFGFFLELQEEVPGEFTFFQKIFDDKFFFDFFARLGPTDSQAARCRPEVHNAE